jgi:hypothetical protein
MDISAKEFKLFADNIILSSEDDGTFVIGDENYSMAYKRDDGD